MVEKFFRHSTKGMEQLIDLEIDASVVSDIIGYFFPFTDINFTYLT